MAEQQPNFRYDHGGPRLTPLFLAKLPYTRAIKLAEMTDFSKTATPKTSKPFEDAPSSVPESRQIYEGDVVIVSGYANPEDAAQSRGALDRMIEEEVKEQGGENGQ
jgi:hypothetical protein